MKKFNTFMKVISALAAAVGTIYIVATYGDKIVAWAKQLLGCRSATATFHFTTSTEQEPVAEQAESESTPVANEEDFEG